MFSAVKNYFHGAWMDFYKEVREPPEQDQFQITGQLSPDEFTRAGDELIKICKGWQWKPASNPKYKCKYFDENKQYLVNNLAICKKRISYVQSGKQENVSTGDGDEIIILHAPQNIQQEQQKAEDLRKYTMYIIYDLYYHTPRMYFSATDWEGKPINNELIKQDIQKQYINQTLTMERFPFIEGITMPTVHPCRHANVLKSMSDAMRENGQKVGGQMALLIFLKFITSVIPTVEFDFTGDLHFQ